MASVDTLVISTVRRNQRLRGPTSSGQQNDLQEELIRDLTSIQAQWNNSIVPLCATLPDGTGDYTDVDAFTDGLDGRTLITNVEAVPSVELGYYFNSIEGRPRTVFEQFQHSYTYVDAQIDTLEATINSGAQGLTQEQKERIGENIFNNTIVSSATSLDGKLTFTEANVFQVAKDLYGHGPGDVVFSGNGTEVLNVSVRAMLEAVLLAHNSNWNTNDPVQHSFSGNDITSGEVDQEYVGPTNPANDGFTGVPANLSEDLNQIRSVIRKFKDPATSWNADIALNATWNPVTAPVKPLTIAKLLSLKGSGTRTDTNPWGLTAEDVGAVGADLGNIFSYTGMPNGSTANPSFTNTAGFNATDDLTAAIDGMAGFLNSLDSVAVESPGSSTQNAFVAWNSNDGKQLRDTPVFVDGTKVGVNISAPISHFHINGSLSLKVVTVNADYTASIDDCIILVDGSLGNVIVTLPLASVSAGRYHVVKRIDSSTSFIAAITRSGSDTIDGLPSQTLDVAFQSLTFICNGANWFIL